MSKKRFTPAGAGLGLNDDGPIAGDTAGDDGEAVASAPARHRQDRRPVCRKHGQQMVAYSTNAMYTFYRCPREGCDERDKKVRPVGPLASLYGNGRGSEPATVEER
ncbi:MAG TPA: hypothetical protein VJ783_22715 [Pirellulales bacterium]|nr:hypothetical protein [Pirellulales bacterium]